MIPVDDVIGRADWIVWPAGHAPGWTAPTPTRVCPLPPPEGRAPMGNRGKPRGVATSAARKPAAHRRPARPPARPADVAGPSGASSSARSSGAAGAVRRQGDPAPRRRRRPHSPRPEDLPRPGLRDPVGLHGADDPDRRPGPGRQAHPVVRLQAAARGCRRLQGPRRLAPGRADRHPAGRPRRRQAGQGRPHLHRPAAVRRREGPDQAGRRRRRRHRSSAATRRVESPSTASR